MTFSDRSGTGNSTDPGRGLLLPLQQVGGGDGNASLALSIKKFERSVVEERAVDDAATLHHHPHALGVRRDHADDRLHLRHRSQRAPEPPVVLAVDLHRYLDLRQAIPAGALGVTLRCRLNAFSVLICTNRQHHLWLTRVRHRWDVPKLLQSIWSFHSH
jgi:hypothetical protein